MRTAIFCVWLTQMDPATERTACHVRIEDCGFQHLLYMHDGWNEHSSPRQMSFEFIQSHGAAFITSTYSDKVA